MTRKEVDERLDQLERLQELRRNYPIGSEVFWALTIACDLVMENESEFDLDIQRLRHTSRETTRGEALCIWTGRAEALPN